MRDDELAEALSAAGVGIWSWDLRTHVKTWSRDLFRLFGLPEDRPRRPSEYMALVHADDRARVESSIRGAIDEATAPVTPWTATGSTASSSRAARCAGWVPGARARRRGRASSSWASTST